MTVLLWAAGGPEAIGRGLALAAALRPFGLRCRFAIEPDVDLLGAIAAAGFGPALVLDRGERSLRRLAQIVQGARALVVDVPEPLEATRVRELAGGRPVVVVGDTARTAAAADLVVAPHAAARDERWLTGLAHLLLREPPRPAPPRMPFVRPTVALRVGARVLDVLDGLEAAQRARFVPHVVAAPGTLGWHGLPAVLRRFDAPPAQPPGADGLGPVLAAAALAVVAPGTGLYETLAAGVPAIVPCDTAAAAAAVAPLVAARAIVPLMPGWRPCDVAGAIDALAPDVDRRRALVEVGRRLVDGQGAARVAARLAALVRAEEVEDDVRPDA